MSKKLFLGAGAPIFRNAEKLRHNPTHAELLLWGYLKSNQLGVKFRRQHPLSIYIADFYCHQHKLIIELDGSIHNIPEVAAHDSERQCNLELDGFKILRFNNQDIYNQLEKVLATIKNELTHFSGPTEGSPFRGRGGLTKRIIPCLDVKDGRTVKGVNFVDLRDAGDPVELAWNYSQQGADELVFLDISATVEKRKTLVELVKAVARQINIPFTIGGGITEIADADALLNAGADKISINSAAVRNPALIDELAKAFGVQFVIVAVDTRVMGDKNIVHLNGGRLPTNKQTLDWILEAESRGAGEILLTSMDHDGTKAGFDNGLLTLVNNAVNIPVIASGGAGSVKHFVDVFQQTNVDAALAASVFHYGEILIPDLKTVLRENSIEVRV
jgi:cyclase